jgi:hypothetical protein
MGLAEEIFAEMCVIPPDRDKIVMSLWPALTQKDGVVFLVIGEQGEIQGGILLRFGDLWYSHMKVLDEKLLFISQKYRNMPSGLRRAKSLCDAAKGRADELGVPLYIGVFCTRRTESKMRFYKSQFGESVGGYFLYGPRSGEYRITEG